MTWRRVNQRMIHDRLRLHESRLRDRLVEIAQASTTIPKLGFLVLDVTPEFAFEQFPVSIFAFTEHQHQLDCELNGTSLLDGVPLLDAKYEYPLGRHDWIGADTTPDFDLVLRSVVDFLCQQWQSCKYGNANVNAYAGNVHTDETCNMLPSELTNLSNGLAETMCFTFDE